MNIVDQAKAAALLRSGQIGVMPTDTIYGLLGSAIKRSVVEKIYKHKQRDPAKAVIILVNSLDVIETTFGIALSPAMKSNLQRIWPGPVSVAFSYTNALYSYLAGKSEGLAFRIPADESLRELLAQSGPLVATSANHQGKPPATNVYDAAGYFGSFVHFYVDGGERNGKPSTLVKMRRDGTLQLLREGSKTFKEIKVALE